MAQCAAPRLLRTRREWHASPPRRVRRFQSSSLRFVIYRLPCSHSSPLTTLRRPQCAAVSIGSPALTTVRRVAQRLAVACLFVVALTRRGSAGTGPLHRLGAAP